MLQAVVGVLAAVLLSGSDIGSGGAFLSAVASAKAEAPPQAPNAPSARLTKIKGLTCTFTTMTVGDWKAGEAFGTVKPAKLTVSFNAVDTQEGTAESVGDAGKSHITVRLVGSYLHFMQLDPYGALYLTTVFDRDSRNGKLLAAHARHEFTPVSLPGLTSRPEQYYGECAVK